MFYYLYEIRNKINGKIYVGVHKTENINDGYMGSGKVIRNAIIKYGIENFEKVILETFENAEAMYAREEEIVNDKFLLRDDVYNLKCGGLGGFDYLNKSGLALRTGAILSDETKRKISLSRTNFKFTDEIRKKLSENNGMKKDINRVKVSKSLTNKKKTSQHKKNIADAIKEWHKKRKAALIQG